MRGVTSAGEMGPPRGSWESGLFYGFRSMYHTVGARRLSLWVDREGLFTEIGCWDRCLCWLEEVGR